MSLSAEKTVIARYLEGFLLHYNLPPLQTYTREGVAESQDWLEALIALHKQPGADPGDADLILALRLLATVPLSTEDHTLPAFTSNLVVLWSRAIIDAAPIRTYTHPRFERLLQFTSIIRELDAQQVKAGVEVLVSVLLDPGEQEQTRDLVSWVLGKLGTHAPVQAYFTALREHLIAPSEMVKRAWQASGSQASLELLLAAFLDKDEDWQVREQAVSMLGQQGKPEVVDALVETIREDDSVTIHAIDALALLGKYIPVDILTELLLHENSWSGWKRIHAARALGTSDQESARQALLTALDLFLNATDDEVAQAQLLCEEIADALIAMPATFPYEQLMAWLNDKNRYHQRIALEKLILLDHEIPVEPLLLILRNPDQQKAHIRVLQICNKQASAVPATDLLNLLQEQPWEPLPSAFLQAFCLPGVEAPIEALFALLADAPHAVALRAQTILDVLHQTVPAELLLTRYEPDDASVDSRDAEWGREALHLGKRLPAEQLITIACACTGFIEDYDDQDMVETLGALGSYIVDALLARLSAYGILDAGLLSRVASRVYEHIPEGKLSLALQRSEGDICLAAGILVLTGDERYQPGLLALLETYISRPEIYCTLLSAFAKWGEHFPGAVLLTALQHEYKTVRTTAVSILRALQPVIETSKLVEPLKARIMRELNDPESEGNWYTDDLIEALGLCGEFTPVAFLATLLEEEACDIAAAQALGEAGHSVPFEVFFTILNSENEYIRAGALSGMGKQKERVPVDQLLLLLASCEEDNAIANAVIEVLFELEEYASVEVLQTLLQQPDEQVRLGASRALAALETRSLQDRITRTWRSRFDDDVVRQSVVATQVALGAQAPFALWVNALEKKRSKEGAASVLDALAQVVPATIANLAPECHLPEMRMVRLRAWGTLGQVEAIIAAARSEKDVHVRQRAIEILGDLGDPMAIEPLTQLLQDNDDTNVRLAIFDALRTFGAAVSVEPLLEHCAYSENEYRSVEFARDPGIEAAEVLKRAHPEAFRTLVPLAESILRGDPPAGVLASRPQYRLAATIGAMGRAEPELLAILEACLDWPNWQVRFKAAEAFGKVWRKHPELGIEPLLKLRFDMRSPAIRNTADDALAEIISQAQSL
jgi:HEAT repeat protein